MKKILLIALFIKAFTLCAQNTITFDTKFLSFTYPSTYQEQKIHNAPHMLIKIASDVSYFSISVWENEINGHVSIWEDKFYDHYKNSLGKDKLVSIDKILVETKNGKNQCLKIKTNIDNNIRMLTYVLINDSDLYVLSYVSPGKYTSISSTDESDNLIKGIYFKTK